MNKQLVATVIAVGSLFWLGGTAPAFSQNLPKSVNVQPQSTGPGGTSSQNQPRSYNTQPIYVGPYGASSGPYPIFATPYNNPVPYYNNVNPYGTQVIIPPVIINNYPDNTFGPYGNYNYPNPLPNTYSNYNGTYYQNGFTP